jgi:hypothetical protein
VRLDQKGADRCDVAVAILRDAVSHRRFGRGLL